MLGAITVGNIEVRRKRMGWDTSFNPSEYTVEVAFPKQVSDDALWKLGRFALELAESDKVERDG